MKKQLRTL